MVSTFRYFKNKFNFARIYCNATVLCYVKTHRSALFVFFCTYQLPVNAYIRNISLLVYVYIPYSTYSIWLKRWRLHEISYSCIFLVEIYLSFNIFCWYVKENIFSILSMFLIQFFKTSFEIWLYIWHRWQLFCKKMKA